MERLFQKLDEKLDKQAEQITQSVTKNVTDAIDDKMNAIIEENKFLKNKVDELENKIKSLNSEKRKNNIVFFGIEEHGKTELELIDYTKKIIEEAGVHIYSEEICNIYRIGKKMVNKNRPVVVSLTTQWKKHLILKNRSNLPSSIYIKEDYCKETLEKRKQLQPQLEEERKKGNIAYLKRDKIVVLEPKDQNRDKRKRESSSSPNETAQKKLSTNNLLRNTSQNTTKIQKSEVIKPSMLNYIEKTRSDPNLTISKN